MDSIKEGVQTPWGRADQVDKFAEGIYCAQTPSHGGIWLSPERQEQLPDGVRKRAWFEEDCEASIPLFVFSADVRGETGRDYREAAAKSILRWNADLCEALGIEKEE